MATCTDCFERLDDHHRCRLASRRRVLMRRAAPLLIGAVIGAAGAMLGAPTHPTASLLAVSIVLGAVVTRAIANEVLLF